MCGALCPWRWARVHAYTCVCVLVFLFESCSNQVLTWLFDFRFVIYFSIDEQGLFLFSVKIFITGCFLLIFRDHVKQRWPCQLCSGRDVGVSYLDISNQGWFD